MARNQEEKYLQEDHEKQEFEEKVVFINRIAKVVKGGRRFRFSAVVVVGDRNGRVGYGTGKAKEIPDAMQKAVQAAKANIITVPIVNKTVPHDALGVAGSGKVFFKPASDGTGVVAGGEVRTVFELAGVSNILAKSLGSPTPINVIRATFDGLKKLRTLKEVAKLRGKKVEEIV